MTFSKVATIPQELIDNKLKRWIAQENLPVFLLIDDLH